MFYSIILCSKSTLIQYIYFLHCLFLDQVATIKCVFILINKFISVNDEQTFSIVYFMQHAISLSQVAFNAYSQTSPLSL